MQQKPLLLAYPNSAAASSIVQLVNRLEGDAEVVTDDTKGIKRLFTNLIQSKLRNKGN